MAPRQPRATSNFCSATCLFVRTGAEVAWGLFTWLGWPVHVEMLGLRLRPEATLQHLPFAVWDADRNIDQSSLQTRFGARHAALVSA